MPFEIGTYLALIGGSLEGSDLDTLGFIDHKVKKEDVFALLEMKQKFSPPQDTLEMKDLVLDSYAIEIDRDKENERILRETLDRSRKENGKKVLLDAYYRKKIVEYANIFENEGFELDKMIKYYEKDNAKILNYTYTAESELLGGIVEQNPITVIKEGPVYSRRHEILELFCGETLEDIYDNLDQSNSPFAQRCKAILKSRDQNIVRSNLYLLRRGANDSFNQCLYNEHKVANLILENPELCPSLFEKGISGKKAVNNMFNHSLVRPKEDLYSNILIF